MRFRGFPKYPTLNLWFIGGGWMKDWNASVSDSIGESHGSMVGGTSWTADSILGTASFRNIVGDYIQLGSVDHNLSTRKI